MNNPRENIVELVNNYIETHYFEKQLSLMTIASEFGYSYNYISVRYKKLSKVNFNDTLNICRINKAKEYLQASDEAIKVIAEKIGFDNQLYFNKVFHKYVGMSPTEYRNSTYEKDKSICPFYTKL